MRRYKDDYMNIVMVTPSREEPVYEQYKGKVGDMRIVENPFQQSMGLGQISGSGLVSGELNYPSWMPIVIIVVSAMALITVYSIMRK